MSGGSSADGIATVTVMRGEVERVRALLPTLAWAQERHVVETAPEPPGWVEDLPSDVHVHHHPLPLGEGFDDARQTGLAAARTDWVLVVDTDERVPGALVEELHARTAEWERGGVTAVRVPRSNLVLDRTLEAGSSWPDHQTRYLRRDASTFQRALHSAATTTGRVLDLPADRRLALEHHAFTSTSQFLHKVDTYTTIEAREAGERVRGGLRPALRAGARDFAARYVHMRGYRDGWHGLHYALLMAGYRYLVEAKRWEAARAPGAPWAEEVDP